MTLKTFAAMLAVLGLAASEPPTDSERNRLTQISVIDALMTGRYEGIMPIADLLKLGDFGVGTLDGLDGELIVLDGEAYQAKGNGEVVKVALDRTTPFAAVAFFESEGEFPCPAVASLKELESRLETPLPQKNRFVAVRIDARFASIRIRSVKRQNPPYRPLAEVAEEQSVWTHEDLKGTLVGIRSPSWAGGLNVPGYHWHFLSDDRRIGGHLLDCRIVEGRVRYDVCSDWLIKLEDSDEFDRLDLVKDRSADLKRVESRRGDEPRP